MTLQHLSRINRLRNVGISAHIDAGKTTLTERMLYYCGRLHEMHDVRGGDGGAFMDSDPIERRRGITIASAATSVQWNDHDINLIDTPGHVDFTVEVERSLRVLDGAVLVLCSVGGVQSQTLAVDRQMKRYAIPRIALINKMDRTGADVERVVRQLRERLNANPVLLQLPIGTGEAFDGVIDLISMHAVYFDGKDGAQVRRECIPDSLCDQADAARTRMLESLADVNDSVADSFISDGEFSTDELRIAIRDATLAREVTPVLLASAYKNRGVQEVLDAIGHYLPDPTEREVHANEFVKDGEQPKQVSLTPGDDSQAVVMAFKTIVDKFGQLTFLRVYQGSLAVGQMLRNVRTGNKVRFGRLAKIHGNQRQDIERIVAGDIAAVVGVDCASGDTFVSEGRDLLLENIVVSPPVVCRTIEPMKRSDSDKLSKALERFRRQDPTFHVLSDPNTGQTQIAGMGQLHLEVYVERLRDECDCPTVVGRPSVSYKERPTKSVDFTHRFKKQNGGKGQFAHIAGRLDPLPADADESFVFDDRVSGGRVSRPFIAAVRKGVLEAMANGPIDGYEVTGVKFTLMDGEEHEKDSSEFSFQLCAAEAMREEILPRCSAELLEPMMSLEIEVPVEFQGAVTGHLGQLRGLIISSEVSAELCTLTATAPLAELFDYANELRSMTQGKGSFTMQPSHYRSVPANVRESIVR